MAQKRRTAKEKAREEHARPVRHAHTGHGHSHEGCGCGDELDESQPASALPMERLLRVLRHALEDRDFHNQRELEEFLAEFSEDDYNQVLSRLTAGSPREQAQQLAYEAIMDAESDEHAVALAERALALDPDCVDARVVMAEITTTDRDDDLAARLEEAVRAGERALGQEFLDEHRGRLWTELEARPYLRARYRLGDALRAAGRIPEATAQLERLLELNPDDQQRAREPLLACYLASASLEPARDLLQRFESDQSAVFHWGRVLERYLSEDLPGAVRALQRAREQNPYADRYLTFRKNPPADWAQEIYIAGDRNEAVHCLLIMGMAWAFHPEAVNWARSA